MDKRRFFPPGRGRKSVSRNLTLISKIRSPRGKRYFPKYISRLDGNLIPYATRIYRYKISHLSEAGRHCSASSIRPACDADDDSAGGATLPSRSPSTSGRPRPLLLHRCLLLLLLQRRCSPTFCCSETPRTAMSPRKTRSRADTTRSAERSPPFSTSSTSPPRPSRARDSGISIRAS